MKKLHRLQKKTEKSFILPLGQLAASEIKAREHVGKADLILLGPQIRYLQKRISEMAPGKPVEVIDMMAYGMMDGKKVYSDIKKYMED